MSTWLITGASGSFGTAFIRTALANRWVDRIIAMSRNATMRYALEEAIQWDSRVSVVPGDVRVPADIDAICLAAGRIDLVVHAAAEKYVGTGQRHRAYVYDINVRGAQHVIEAAQRHRIPRIIALSTDKAVEPVNYYGETKSRAERLFLANDGIDGLRVTVTRYGNVAASSGSVIPLFIKQRESGRLTVTDLGATRFFMPLADALFCDCAVLQEPEREPVMSAVALVKYAIDNGNGGEILIPSIPSGTIQNLAEEIGPGCVIEETGLKDGEKLHEKLIADTEIPRTYRLLDGVFCVMKQTVHYMTPVEATFRYTSDADPQRIEIARGQAVAA